MQSKYLRGFVAGAVAGALALSGTAALAGSGIGGVFNLGQANTTTGTTSLTGGSSSASTLKVINTNGGAGLEIGVKNGNVAPLRVYSDARIAHLNADRVDGNHVLRARVTEVLNSGNGTVLSVVGFGTIEASCSALGSGYRLFWRNSLSGVTMDVWWDDGTSAVGYASVAAGGGTYVAPIDVAKDRIVTIQAGLASGATATVSVTAHSGASGCVFYAQSVGG